MKSNEILSAKLIDVIFDGRNKEYGAYELRNTYSRRIKKAMLVTFIVTGLVFGGAVLANSFKKNPQVYRIQQITELTAIKQDQPPEKLPDPIKPIEEPPVQQEKFTQIEIVKDEDFKEPPPSQEDLIDSKIGSEDIKGAIDSGISRPPQEIVDKRGIVDVKPTDPDEIVTFVEIDAKFNGNWKAFLERNLNANVAIDNNAPSGRYTVVIQFVVDKTGTVSDIKALTNHGYGMEEEALRVLRKAAKWEPAIQNGIPVKAYRKQGIVFDVQGDE